MKYSFLNINSEPNNYVRNSSEIILTPSSSLMVFDGVFFSRKKFLTNWIDMFDYIVVFVSFIFTVLAVALDLEGDVKLIK